MKNIILIQHPQSVHHTNGMIGSWTDWELSELGKVQANRIGKKLSQELKGQAYVMYASDLQRTMQTATIISNYLNIIPIKKLELRERHLGIACGQSVNWLHEHQIPYADSVDHCPIEGAETRREVWERLIPFYEEILTSPQENIIIVSHGDTLSVFCAMWLKFQVKDLNEKDLFGMAGGVSFLYENSHGKRLIRRLSDLSYIQE